MANDLAKETDLAAAAAFRNRHRVLQLRHVERDESLHTAHGSASLREARLGPSEQPSALHRTTGRANLSPGT